MSEAQGMSVESEAGVEMPQSVVTVELSGWWRRVGATLIDGIVLVIPGILLAGLTGAGHLTHGSTSGSAHTNWTSSVLLGIYVLIMLPRASWNGQTVGKRVMAIKVVRDDGLPVDWRTVMRRDVPWKAALGVIATLTSGTAVVLVALVLGLLDCLWPLWDPKGNRALHDMTASTHVVRVRPLDA